MMKIQSISASYLSLATIATALSIPMPALADDFSRSGTNDDGIKPVVVRVERKIQPDDGIKPVLPQVKRSGTDDSIRIVLPTFQRSTHNGDGIRLVQPKVQQSGTDDDSLRKILRQGQGDESI